MEDDNSTFRYDYNLNISDRCLDDNNSMEDIKLSSPQNEYLLDIKKSIGTRNSIERDKINEIDSPSNKQKPIFNRNMHFKSEEETKKNNSNEYY